MIKFFILVAALAIIIILPTTIFVFGYMDQPWTPPPPYPFQEVDQICSPDTEDCPPDPCADKPLDEQCMRAEVFNNLSDLQQSSLDNTSAFLEALNSTSASQITSLCLGPPGNDLWGCVKNWNENHTVRRGSGIK